MQILINVHGYIDHKDKNMRTCKQLNLTLVEIALDPFPLKLAEQGLKSGHRISHIARHDAAI